MGTIKNALGDNAIVEITKTKDVVYVGGECEAHREGSLFRTKSTGNLKVVFAGDDDAREVILTIDEVNRWQHDRIKRIIEVGTTIPAADILLGR